MVGGVCLVCGAAGLLTKAWPGPLRDVAAGQGEDFFGTVFLLLAPRLALPRAAFARFATPILAILVAIELSQLSRAPWLERLREEPLARRVLGTTFEWADLVAYALGALAAWAIDRAATRGRPEG